MARLTVRLPETLHNQLVQLAEREGVSLNQYITYTLARQVARSYTVTPVTEESKQKQRDDYATLLQGLGESSYQEMQKVLNERDSVGPDYGLTQDVVQKLRERIATYGRDR